MRQSPFFFKKSKVRGNEYYQIWHREVGFLHSLGSPEGCWKKLVSWGKASEDGKNKLTKITKNTTNFDEVEIPHDD